MLKIDAFKTLLNMVTASNDSQAAELTEFLNTQIAQCEARTVKSRERAAAKAKEPDALYDAVIAALTKTKAPMLPADILAAIPASLGASEPMVRSRCIAGVKAGVVTKVTVEVNERPYVAYVAA